MEDALDYVILAGQVIGAGTRRATTRCRCGILDHVAVLR